VKGTSRCLGPPTGASNFEHGQMMYHNKRFAGQLHRILQSPHIDGSSNHCYPICTFAERWPAIARTKLETEQRCFIQIASPVSLASNTRLLPTVHGQMKVARGSVITRSGYMNQVGSFFYNVDLVPGTHYISPLLSPSSTLIYCQPNNYIHFPLYSTKYFLSRRHQPCSTDSSPCWPQAP